LSFFLQQSRIAEFVTRAAHTPVRISTILDYAHVNAS